MTEHKPLPVAGYKAQSEESVKMVNQNKEMEEVILRRLDYLSVRGGCSPKWLAIGRTHLEQAFMAINRAIFQPERVKLD